MKNLAFATLAATFAVNALATPTVTGVSARQRWPWNNLVDVTFTVSGSDSQEDFYRVDVSATYPGVVGDRLPARTLRDEPLVKGDGTHRLVWDMGADAPGLVTSNLTVQVTVAPFGATEPVYMVVDLSSGPESSSYPVHYTFESPDLADDTCRTTELWLRRCPAGTFQMGYTSGDKPDTVPPHTVSLTKPFYIAVFETTQQQWHQVMGTWPSFFSNTTYRATRPVETVSLNNIRGKDKINYNWYASPVSAVRVTSFMGRLRARAGTALATADLPTEAQWEYACRAGTTTPTYYSNITGADFWSPARYAGRSKFDAGTSDGDSDTTVGTAKVGSYPANPWGLYDMVGNVLEWCGDGNPFTGTGAWNYESDFSAYTAATPLVDPRTTLPSYNATYYDAWVGRGGSFVLDWYFMSSQRRYQLWDSTGKSWGFRTCVTGQ